MHNSAQELTKWRARVPKLASALRERTDEAQALQAECESLRARNEQLFETTSLASRELEALTDTVALLRARIRALESELAGALATRAADDLTRIRGIGPKLAEQLNALGIHRFCQVAELDEEALCRDDHALHGHRGRILRDGWIAQAARLAASENGPSISPVNS